MEDVLRMITNQGKVRYILSGDSMNTKMFIRFIQLSVKDGDRKTFLILNNMRVHHANVVKGWLKEHAEEIELLFLPAYSPALNLNEYLNCGLKAGLHSKSRVANVEGLRNKVQSHMSQLQRSPGRVQKYFKQPKISYAT